MNLRKATLIFFAACGIYFLGRGGFEVISAYDSTSGLLTYLAEPLRNATPFDFGVGFCSLLLLFWVALLGDDHAGVSRTALLRAVGLSSGVIALAALVVNFTHFAFLGTPHFVALLGVWALLQSAIGVGAGLLLFAARESRAPALLPLSLNGITLAATAALFLAPLYL